MGARKDADGEVLWRVQVVALGDGDAEIIRLTVAGIRSLGTTAGWVSDFITPQV